MLLKLILVNHSLLASKFGAVLLKWEEVSHMPLLLSREGFCLQLLATRLDQKLPIGSQQLVQQVLWMGCSNPRAGSHVFEGLDLRC